MTFSVRRPKAGGFITVVITWAHSLIHSSGNIPLTSQPSPGFSVPSVEHTQRFGKRKKGKRRKKKERKSFFCAVNSACFQQVPGWEEEKRAGKRWAKEGKPHLFGSGCRREKAKRETNKQPRRSWNKQRLLRGGRGGGVVSLFFIYSLAAQAQRRDGARVSSSPPLPSPVFFVLI